MHLCVPLFAVRVDSPSLASVISGAILITLCGVVVERLLAQSNNTQPTRQEQCTSKGHEQQDETKQNSRAQRHKLQKQANGK